MKKSTLRLLGRLQATKIRIFEEERTSVEEWANKLKLLDHIFREIQENSRGFKKSKLPYISAGEFLIQGKNYKLPYSDIHKQVTQILLNREFDP